MEYHLQGCDASVLLESINGQQAEKDTPPNETLIGFDVIEKIKSKVEETCPATVSCSDILVLAATEGVVLGSEASVLRESKTEKFVGSTIRTLYKKQPYALVFHDCFIQSEKDTPPNETLKGFDVIEASVLAGGPFYPLPTGRRDSPVSFPQVASYELPSSHDDLSKTLTSFARRGFDQRETVSLLGAHSTGMVHCMFLYNCTGTGEPGYCSIGIFWCERLVFPRMEVHSPQCFQATDICEIVLTYNFVTSLLKCCFWLHRCSAEMDADDAVNEGLNAPGAFECALCTNVFNYDKLKGYYSHLNAAHQGSYVCTKCLHVSEDKNMAKIHVSCAKHKKVKQQTPKWVLSNWF